MLIPIFIQFSKICENKNNIFFVTNTLMARSYVCDLNNKLLRFSKPKMLFAFQNGPAYCENVDKLVTKTLSITALNVVKRRRRRLVSKKDTNGRPQL